MYKKLPDRKSRQFLVNFENLGKFNTNIIICQYLWDKMSVWKRGKNDCQFLAPSPSVTPNQTPGIANHKNYKSFL